MNGFIRIRTFIVLNAFPYSVGRIFYASANKQFRFRNAVIVHKHTQTHTAYTHYKIIVTFS